VLLGEVEPVEPGQYSSGSFRAVCSRLGVRQSMGRTGVCWDNAQAETFFASLKVECVYRTAIPSVDRARRTIGRYIEVFYRGRDGHCWPPPAQIPACASNALGS
jgi:putative transposase